MNVTQDVMNDLLPVYFSGEASEDTRTLMEEYFRENPEFERMARGSARPLDALKVATWPGLSPSAEREKRDLECVHREMWRRKLSFGLALFFTLAPLAFTYSKGHLTWMMLRDQPWNAALYWGLGIVLWIFYFGRVSRRTFTLAIAIFFTLFPVFDILHYELSSHQSVESLHDLIWEVTLFCGVAIVGWYQYLARPRRFRTALLFASFLTLAPIPFLLYPAFAGGPRFVSGGEVAIVWDVAAVIWIMYFRLKGKMDAGC